MAGLAGLRAHKLRGIDGSRAFVGDRRMGLVGSEGGDGEKTRNQKQKNSSGLEAYWH
jgi:hypothetical protein